MKIIRLPESTINQIAAGEVVERPASVVKELIENALDAGATRIELASENGGKSLLRITDNGFGMSREELQLAIERHCTSKLSDDLMDIRTLGFRGEALPSIGSVSRLKIVSRQADGDTAWQISVNHGDIGKVEPAALPRGTKIEVRDLFANVPARLKFLKTDRAESGAIADIFKRMALAFPRVHFALAGDERAPVEYVSGDLSQRIGQVIGKEFVENALGIDSEREGVKLRGLAGVPTFNRSNGLHQYFYVNGRPVKDKQLLGAVRGAYADFLPRGRFPVLVLFLELPPHEVDVNVHPAKAEVRFRDAGLVRGLIVGSIKRAIHEAGPTVSSEGTAKMAGAFRPNYSTPGQPGSQPHRTAGVVNWNTPVAAQATLPTNGFSEQPQSSLDYPAALDSTRGTHELGPSGQVVPPEDDQTAYPLGAARAQVHKNYIVSQTQTGMVIVDQHAAHERIVYEKLKKGLEGTIASQMLLIPEIIDLPEEGVDMIAAAGDELARFGLLLEKFGPGAIIVRETPAMLGEIDSRSLVTDLVDELAEWGSSQNLAERLEHLAATIACHHSVRSGRIMKGDEMNALLRQMEVTPNSGQCNHGRPTWIELDLKDIERLFGR